MLIHPWDATTGPSEWREWLGTTDRFGELAVNNRDAALAPLVLPTHFTMADTDLLTHFARANPVWPHLEVASQVRLSVVGDHAYIPSCWRGADGAPAEAGVPTSYYASVQFVCLPVVVDDPAAKAELLAAQLADFQPEGGHPAVDANAAPYGRMLAGIRGVRLHVIGVDAKFKYDDHKPVEQRAGTIGRLAARARDLDVGAARQQRRRLDVVGEWRRSGQQS